jgi:hypothetical protein
VVSHGRLDGYLGKGEEEGHFDLLLRQQKIGIIDIV